MQTQEQEDQDYELNARYDYMSEAYGNEARLLNQMAEDDARYDTTRYWEEYADAAEATGTVPFHEADPFIDFWGPW